ncbi:MAG: hypothetical protein A2579_01330 [Lysobacterales bacterium RIFOXYD1_FULL_69_11]|nr:MAG: hypothetical protein A2190_11740 [Xanthomonadales bacterium RIFOXYA1_FULL_69_10]OHE86956.1 MAG: hypothetical protein A2579_01330 [Xanthomonadales bacterium RIFOXYD1_FULL_69_11]
MPMRPTLVLRHPANPISRAPSLSAMPSMPGQVDSGALLRGSREILIRHGGETYRLRHTRNDKLILTK